VRNPKRFSQIAKALTGAVESLHGEVVSTSIHSEMLPSGLHSGAGIAILRKSQAALEALRLCGMGMSCKVSWKHLQVSQQFDSLMKLYSSGGLPNA
jgi:hypothetical protein